MTQAQRIYQLFKENEGKELNHRIIVDFPPNGLGITGYSERITNVRKKIGCTCGNKLMICNATEHVVNTRKNYYKYVNTTSMDTKVQMVNFDTNSRKQSLQQRIEGLRKQWKDADSHRKTEIEKEGKLLKVQLELIERSEKSKHVQKVDVGVSLVNEAQKALL